MTKKATNAQIEAAIRSEAAITSLVAAKLGITRQAVFMRIKGSPHLQAVVRDVEERILDQAEGQVIKKIQAGRERVVLWYLERKGKARGYANKVEATVGFSDETAEAIVQALGGDLEKLRQLRAQLSET